MNHFISNGNYKAILQALQLDSTEVLRRAKLPEDTLTHKTITMSEAGYYRFLQAISDSLNSEAPLLQLASKEQIETFSPPIFASWCSKNGEACIERLAAYKKLIGPMSWHIAKNNEELTVTMETGDSELQLPSILVQSDFSFLIGMLRRATKTSIHPVYLQVKDLPASHALSDIAGIPIQKGSSNSITFRLADLRLPFICFNPAMWSYFEPEMNKRLAELTVDDSMSARVRSALASMLPSGNYSVEDVAEKLGVSKRTLQRKLNKEKTTFQKQLSSTRETLAIHYLCHTDMSNPDISFLLGYAELNSFLRAFIVWTGKSVSKYRREKNNPQKIQ
jgi:AraC-like DNA-binding protein